MAIDHRCPRKATYARISASGMPSMGSNSSTPATTAATTTSASTPPRRPPEPSVAFARGVRPAASRCPRPHRQDEEGAGACRQQQEGLRQDRRRRPQVVQAGAPLGGGFGPPDAESFPDSSVGRASQHALIAQCYQHDAASSAGEHHQVMRREIDFFAAGQDLARTSGDPAHVAQPDGRRRPGHIPRLPSVLRPLHLRLLAIDPIAQPRGPRVTRNDGVHDRLLDLGGDLGRYVLLLQELPCPTFITATVHAAERFPGAGDGVQPVGALEQARDRLLGRTGGGGYGRQGGQRK